MRKRSFRFFENRECEYYPCHKGLDEINCLFCYCPLYFFADCGGNYILTEKGVKNCSTCLVPHGERGYEIIQKKLKKYIQANVKG